MSKKSLNKKYWILVESNGKYRCFSTTDVRNQLNVITRYNNSYELIGIYDKEINVSSEDWVSSCSMNGSEESNLVGLKRNYANKEILLKYNSFEISELLYFAYCASERLYIKKNEFEDIKWAFKEEDLKFGRIEHPMFVKDSDIGDYDIKRYYECYKLNKLVGGVEVSGWVVISDRQKNKNDSKK